MLWNGFNETYMIDESYECDLSSQVLAACGTPRILPANFYRNTSVNQRGIVSVSNGLYGLPTVELVMWLKAVIAGRRAIEIGAGHGALAQALGIQATDSKMQEDPNIAAYYQKLRQPVVTYGDHVEKLDAAQAIEKYQPQVVVASWVTHQYRSDRHDAGGSIFGVDEEAIIGACETYIVIGNSKVHAGKSIWNLPHKRIEPDWLFSRAQNGSPNFIAIWGAC